MVHPLIEQIKGKLIISCQALPGEPLYRPEGGIMVLMAKAALEAGAVAIRAQGITDIKQIKEAFDVPVIGIIKKNYEGYDSYITATMDEVDALVEAGSDIIALDATLRQRGDGSTVNEFVQAIKAKYPEQLLMADISNLEEGLNAAELGFDLIGTTMNGYTPYTEGQSKGPNFELMKQLVEQTNVPIVAEGKIHSPEDLAKAFEQGIHTAVVGGAITRPLEIARRFMAVVPEA
ncbi:N-acetylmannosamine-6-phosphate 2-epimerase [Aerococcaceae bacterium zg-ZJ1578]|uniref:N-acetylmannosamine-6-phosphate 2-epimerase n=1 Tax=Aerococcaceae bacterium zg-252 TaxID=2796928 RepID=UPI001A3001B1|nr:N-acetylmannosamine-6-phosphate 2-epimerase [Aerococcaceae bacterium zg-1578]MBR7926922.1 N-acetylmannosamine-6-phosphate 2-epimerase [Aerococcaceae bacterium zg-ZUI334]MBS4462525.1 N-acetylmannosamine-6-phosphate 2-epimerase [Aerococcaceae bacterium zg-B36]